MKTFFLIALCFFLSSYSHSMSVSKNFKGKIIVTAKSVKTRQEFYSLATLSSQGNKFVYDLTLLSTSDKKPIQNIKLEFESTGNQCALKSDSMKDLNCSLVLKEGAVERLTATSKGMDKIISIDITFKNGINTFTLQTDYKSDSQYLVSRMNEIL